MRLRGRVGASILACLLLLAGFYATARALDYGFSVEKETVNAYWNRDGSLSLDYVWVFANGKGSRPIDVVDVGMPNGSFEVSGICAQVNDQVVTAERASYQGSGSGFAVLLGARSIQPGAKGTVHVSIESVQNALYQENSDASSASAQFSPTWFGPQYVRGQTDLTVIFHLPPGVKSSEAHFLPSTQWPDGSPPVEALDREGRVTYTWHSASAEASEQYILKAAFKRGDIPVVDPRTGPLPAPSSVNTRDVAPLIIAALFAGYVIFLLYANWRNKLSYLPPKISIEGHGIRRKLDEIEVGLVMGLPLDQILEIMFVSSIKKAGLVVVSREPFVTRLKDDLPGILRTYEYTFLKALEDRENQRAAKLQELLTRLVRHTTNGMRGFSRKDTIAYHKSTIRDTWKLIKETGIPEQAGLLFEDKLGWLLLDADFAHNARQNLPDQIVVSWWWQAIDPQLKTCEDQPLASQGAGLVRSRDLMDGFTGVLKLFSANVVGDLAEFTSGVTKTTNPTILKRYGSGRFGHGGGCACAGCACACAGCACACAGGGR